MDLRNPLSYHTTCAITMIGRSAFRVTYPKIVIPFKKKFHFDLYLLCSKAIPKVVDTKYSKPVPGPILSLCIGIDNGLCHCSKMIKIMIQIMAHFLYLPNIFKKNTWT